MVDQFPGPTPPIIMPLYFFLLGCVKDYVYRNCVDDSATSTQASDSCDHASLMWEKKELTDDTSKDVYSLLAQYVSGIIMPIVRRQTE